MVSGMVALPEVKLRQQIPTERHIELYCDWSLTGFLPPLTYNLAIIILCALHGFLTRKLPENFNDAWYIFVSVTTTSFLWMVFLPTYFTSIYASNQVILLASCLLLNAAISLLCLYCPKLYAIYFLDEAELKIAPSMAIGSSTVNPSVVINPSQSIEPY